MDIGRRMPGIAVDVRKGISIGGSEVHSAAIGARPIDDFWAVVDFWALVGGQTTRQQIDAIQQEDKTCRLINMKISLPTIYLRICCENGKCDRSQSNARGKELSSVSGISREGKHGLAWYRIAVKQRRREMAHQQKIVQLLVDCRRLRSGDDPVVIYATRFTHIDFDHDRLTESGARIRTAHCI